MTFRKLFLSNIFLLSLSLNYSHVYAQMNDHDQDYERVQNDINPKRFDFFRSILKEYIANQPDLFYQKSFSFIDDETNSQLSRDAVVKNLLDARQEKFIPTLQFQNYSEIRDLNVVVSTNIRSGGYPTNHSIEFQFRTENSRNIEIEFIELWRKKEKLFSIQKKQMILQSEEKFKYCRAYFDLNLPLDSGFYEVILKSTKAEYKYKVFLEKNAEPKKLTDIVTFKKRNQKKLDIQWIVNRSNSFVEGTDKNWVYLAMVDGRNTPTWKSQWEPGMPNTMTLSLESDRKYDLNISFLESKSWGGIEVVQAFQYSHPL